MKVLFTLAVVAAQTLFLGYTVKTLWWWFIVPTFHAPAIDWRVGLGIALLVATTAHQMPDIAERKKEWWRAAVHSAAWCGAYATILLTGWIVR